MHMVPINLEFSQNVIRCEAINRIASPMTRRDSGPRAYLRFVAKILTFCFVIIVRGADSRALALSRDVLGIVCVARTGRCAFLSYMIYMILLLFLFLSRVNETNSNRKKNETFFENKMNLNDPNFMFFILMFVHLLNS